MQASSTSGGPLRPVEGHSVETLDLHSACSPGRFARRLSRAPLPAGIASPHKDACNATFSHVAMLIYSKARGAVRLPPRSETEPALQPLPMSIRLSGACTTLSCPHRQGSLPRRKFFVFALLHSRGRKETESPAVQLRVVKNQLSALPRGRCAGELAQERRAPSPWQPG